MTGKTSDTLGAASALLLNAMKALGGIDDHFELISAQVLEPGVPPENPISGP